MDYYENTSARVMLGVASTYIIMLLIHVLQLLYVASKIMHPYYFTKSSPVKPSLPSPPSCPTLLSTAD